MNNSSLLQTWRESQPFNRFNPDHPSEERMIALASPGGLARAEEEEIEHLQSCPGCLSHWAAWRRAYEFAGRQEFADNDLSSPEIAFGYLEAAADHHQAVNGQRLESSCGSFRLEILPARENPSQALVILSDLSGQAQGSIAVRDRNGELVLEGRLSDGRLVGRHENINDLDLQFWTITGV